MKIVRFLKLFLEGLLIPVILYLAFLLISTITTNHWWTIILSLLFGVFLVFWGIGVPGGYADPPEPKPYGPLLGIFGILVVVWTIPAIIIYWALEPESLKKGLQVTSLIVGLCFGIIYYWYKYSNEKPSISDKITYFTGVTLAPPTILEFLLK